jgi:UDP-galactopyranose mutase
MFDFLVVGAGLFGATCARLLVEAGKSVQVVEKRATIGGNCYDELVDLTPGPDLTPSPFPEREGELLVNRYGGHIFHTSSREIWDFVRRFGDFRAYEHRVKAKVGQKIYSFPVNLMTLQEVYGVRGPEEARGILKEGVCHTPLYQMFYEGYSRKQWGDETPAGVIERIPVRLTWDDRYYSDVYQGMPELGYTEMIRRMLGDVSVSCDADYLQEREFWDGTARQVIYSGSIDALFGYDDGRLPWRSLRWENEIEDEDFQGCATVNYCDAGVPFTRILEWQHYGHRGRAGKSLITREYAEAFEPGAMGTSGNEAMYPVRNEASKGLYESYLKRLPENVWVGGRLGSYRYLDMDETIGQAMAMCTSACCQRMGPDKTVRLTGAD